MDDLISRQAALDAFYKRPNIDWTTLDVLAEINALPAAQPKKVLVAEIKLDGEELQRYIDKAVEHIREEETPEIIACADCKHWICHDRRCGVWNHAVKPLDWCSYAERREG